MNFEKNYQIGETGEFYKMIGESLNQIWKIRQFAKDRELLNSQMYLNYEDALNKISVMDPND